MWSKYFSVQVVNHLNTLSTDYERVASALEFVVILESIKYLDFINVHEETLLVDIIKKLKIMKVPVHITQELNDYRNMRNAICHNSTSFMMRLEDKDYYKEYSLLAANLINVIIKYITDNPINFTYVEKKYQRYLETVGRQTGDIDKKEFIERASRLRKSNIFT